MAILADNFGKEELTSPLHDWLQTILAGSAEHTRNGYDALHAVRSAFGKLAYPAVAIAISRFKVHCESRDVIHSCLHAIESVMNQMGFALAERTTLVLGAQGALGRKAMDILQARIGSKSLFGVDIVQPEPEPDWTYAPNLGLLPDHALEQADLFFGVIGASICRSEWIERLLLATRKEHLFFASGSTKTVEFAHLTDWLLEVLRRPKRMVGGELLKAAIREIHDPKTGAHQGRTVRLTFGAKTVSLHLLANLMPVNFLYYGVPSETMNHVMCELLGTSALLVRRHAEKTPLPPALLALDHDIFL